MGRDIYFEKASWAVEKVGAAAEETQQRKRKHASCGSDHLHDENSKISRIADVQDQNEYDIAEGKSLSSEASKDEQIREGKDEEDDVAQEVEEEDDHVIGSVSLGSGDAWPCYWRPFFIAAYRMVQTRTEDELDCPQELILDTITMCCPPDRSKVDNSKVPCGNIGHIFQGFGLSQMGGIRSLMGFADMLSSPQDMLDERACLDANNRTVLDTIDLDPIVELLLLHHRCNIPSSVVRRVSRTMAALENYLPKEEEHLAGTPYAAHKGDSYQYADERWNELTLTFMKAAAFRRASASIC